MSSPAAEVKAYVEKFHNSYPTGPDAATHVLIGSFRNAFYIANFAIWGVTIIACLSWYLWRSAKLRRAPVQFLHDDDKSTAPGGQSSARSGTPRWRQSETQEATAVEINSDELLQFRPLRTSWFGRACYWLCCAVSAQFLALYVIFLVDFYNRCQVGSIDNLCFSGDHFLFGSYMTNGQTFFVVWCLSVIWFTGWVFNKGRVVNWFRVPCALPEATHVHVRAPAAVEVVSSHASPVVAVFRRMKHALTPESHKGHFKTVDIVGGPPPGIRAQEEAREAAVRAALKGGGNRNGGAASANFKPPAAAAAASRDAGSVVNPLRISRDSIGRRSSGLDDDAIAALAAAAIAAGPAAPSAAAAAAAAAAPAAAPAKDAANGAKDAADEVDDIPNRYFVFQGIRFIADDLSGRVRRARLTVGTTTADFHAVAAAGGLTHAEVARRMLVVGENACPFRPSTLGELIVDEWFTMFHVYQLVQYILWYWFSYLFVAVIMTVVVLLSGGVAMFLVHRAQLAIAEVAHVHSLVSVKRERGEWTEIDSREVVPGDIVRLFAGAHVPCDLIVVAGSAVVDESSLTGESMPTVKSAAPSSAAPYDVRQPIPRHTLFSGTTIKQAGAGGRGATGSVVPGKKGAAATEDDADDDEQQENYVTAVAVATGMDTSKGDLLSVILFPASMVFKYDEELTVVITMLLVYASVCFALSIVFQQMAGNQSDWVTKWMYATAIVNQVLSPLLPVALEVGQIHSMERLKRHGINCLQPKRIMISGKIRVFCFDKTGTLTKEGLDFVGFQPPAADGSKMGPLLAATDAQAEHLVGLATCNNAEKVGDTIVANEVEYKMFQATGWKFTSSDGVSPVVLTCGEGKAHVVHQRNDFCHSRMTQSVIVEKPCGVTEIYVKGSFETVAAFCKPETLPADYASVAQRHALAGCYVLALAKRVVGEKGSPLTVPMDRDDMERDLTFQGLIIFRNELREDSAATIAKLKAGDIRAVMITGDSPQCGVHIARECGLTGHSTPIFLGEFDSKQGTVVWHEMSADNEGKETNLTTDELLAKHESKLKSGEVELAVTGSAFKILQLMGKAQELLYYTRVFARVKPEGKIRVIDAFIASGVVVGMCGDGGNDCGALRMAHTGVALSEAEASMVSPFTSKIKSVAAVEELLREGRAALHTSIASYKFLITYGLLFSVLKLACYYYGVIMCQAAYMLIEGIAIICLPYTMTLALPAKILRQKRPTHGLLSAITIASVLGLWAINTAFTSGALEYMRKSPDYVPWPAKFAAGKDWWTLGDNWEATVLFFCTLFQFITSAVVFSFGSGFTRNVTRNWALMLVYVFLAGLGVALLLSTDNYLTFVFHIASQEFNDPTPTSPAWIAYQQAGGAPSPGMSFKFRLGLFFLLAGNLACQALWQAFVVTGPVSRVLKRLYPSTRPRFRL